MPTWTNLINGCSLLWLFFPFSAHKCYFFFWMEFNYYSLYYTGSFYCSINACICIINIGITLMFNNMQYAKTIALRSHPLLLVSNASCPFDEKIFAAWAYLLPWFQRRSGGECNALRLTHQAEQIRLHSSDSCACAFCLICSCLICSSSFSFQPLFISVVRTGRHMAPSLEVSFCRTQCIGFTFHLLWNNRTLKVGSGLERSSTPGQDHLE